MFSNTIFFQACAYVRTRDMFVVNAKKQIAIPEECFQRDLFFCAVYILLLNINACAHGN